MLCKTFDNYVNFSLIDSPLMKKLILNFNSKDSKKIKNPQNFLGGKGANLSEMGEMGLPVPPGFTISTKVCENFL
jgi:pyruvate,orthophosphate dikinase